MPNNGAAVPRCPDGLTYGKGCRCSFCRKTVAAMNARYRLRVMQKERGVISPDDLVPVDDIRELLIKVARQRKRHITDRDLELLTGLNSRTIYMIRSGKTQRCRRDTAERIIKALEYDDYIETRHPMTQVDGAWLRQMSLSLCAQGFTRDHQRELIERHLGVKAGFLRVRGDKRNKKVYYRSVEHMRWLVRAVGDATGPSTVLAKRMRTRGIFPTKHYDANGRLIRSSLSPEQRKLLEGV